MELILNPAHTEGRGSMKPTSSAQSNNEILWSLNQTPFGPWLCLEILPIKITKLLLLLYRDQTALNKEPWTTHSQRTLQRGLNFECPSPQNTCGLVGQTQTLEHLSEGVQLVYCSTARSKSTLFILNLRMNDGWMFGCPSGCSDSVFLQEGVICYFLCFKLLPIHGEGVSICYCVFLLLCELFQVGFFPLALGIFLERQ